jgi:predicted DNA-binding protein
LSVTVSFRIPRELKEKMDRLRGYVNWSEEVRRFLERRVRELEQAIAIEELERVIRELPETPRGTAARYVREDRDSH